MTSLGSNASRGAAIIFKKSMHLFTLTGAQRHRQDRSKQQFRFSRILSTDKMRHIEGEAVCQSSCKLTQMGGEKRRCTMCTHVFSLLVFCLEN